MSDREPADQLYHHLLSLHEAAFEGGSFELGYHLLAAALHAAEELDSLELLTEIGKLAGERQKKVDELKPEHRLSSNSARKRGNPAQYAALVAIAAAVKGRITADRALHRSQNTRGTAWGNSKTKS
ncbi:MAG: hypothetical protein ACJ8BF_09295 [Gemmatimonadales bacterium]